ncbi:FAD-binding oxidoreductase, partial [candidate division KSB1 bacterium]|nr:FAD-binding oxidoreductase [candidate division KSB1 bacterium]
MKKIFGLTDEDLKYKYLPGYDKVKLKKESQLKPDIAKKLKLIVGEENVAVDDFSRANHAFGKYYTDLVKLRTGKVETPPDAVVYPRTDKDVEKIIKICHEGKIAVTPYGGHSSVTRGVETPKGGISLDLTKHLNKVLNVSEVNSSVTVQAGMYGPPFEEYLNNYGIGYSCGHFPQSFEYSTVGGWAAARGAGQNSTGYGKMESMVLSMKFVTPRGIIETRDFPARAQGWDLDQIFMGCEGTLGVITELTMKIRKFQPSNTSHISFIFKNFESAVTAMRESMQSQFGLPHLFRISDAEETDIAFKMKGFEDSFVDKFLQALGHKPGKRCLMFVTVEGDKDYTKFVSSKIKKIARKHNALKCRRRLRRRRRKK